MREYYVYIMASRSGVLYTGVTSDLERRVLTHKRKIVPGFTAWYNVTRLVHSERTNDVHAALAREKQIKARRRSKKIELIEGENPTCRDLAEEWDGPSLDSD